MVEPQSVNYPNPFRWFGHWISHLVLAGAGVVGGTVRTSMSTIFQSLVSDEFLAKCLQAIVFALIGAVVSFGKDVVTHRLRKRGKKGRENV